MGYRYSAVHNTLIHDGKDDDDDKRVIQDGEGVRVPLMMRDSSVPPPGAKIWQHSPIPMRDSDLLKDGNGSGEDGDSRVPSWAMDRAARILGRDSVKIDGDVKLVSRQELIDWEKAELSARWKGGLTEGDRVHIGDRDLVVSGRNPENGKLQLRDASTSTPDAATARREAYVTYDAEIQSRYLNSRDAAAGESCVTAGRETGTWRERAKDGRLVCVPDDKSSKEFALAGPLSDAERVQVKQQAYMQYDSEVSERWRR